MFIPIVYLELYIDVLWVEKIHVSTKPSTWTRTQRRVGVLGWQVYKCSVSTLNSIAIHWIDDLVALTHMLRLGGFIQGMQGGNCEMHMQINLDILIWNKIQYERNQQGNCKKHGLW